ncbi:zinc finger domain-containing protein [Paractinoplanes toevensis]|uniref:DNA-binding phage zinc finger domain-containing protein n=1 Tax=Paractinoplanes toevensis TaxID=571911 RepID=A0A919T4L8_9ACTN|nr:hypothetical protein [Actinoplanes toevensis]GIM88768.1 hypothetical protein Ato02nite_005610 [Actinoplanes toevensis]
MTTAIDTRTVALTWQSYDGNELVTRTVPVLPDGAADLAARFAEIPGIRNPRIDTTRTVELGDVPAPRYGWTEDERHEVPMFATGYAALAVRCPKCQSPGGMSCTSTGGGNRATVVTHKARFDRIAGWTNAVQEHAVLLVKAVGHHGWGRSDLFACFEAAAAPIPVKAEKAPTPKGVRLSEKQSEYIEIAVHYDPVGVLSCPTSHLHGEHEIRQSILALEAKGIIEWTGYSDDGYSRNARLTSFGWQVYRQHRLIIRRLDEAEVDRREAEAAR